MADILEPAVRSYIMSQIKSKDTKPEMTVRRFLFANGFRFRTHDKKLPGKPDLVLKKYNTVVFVHGCFWHGHENCKHFKMPKSRREYWVPKIENNIARDRNNIQEVLSLGWNIIVIWECELTKVKLERTLQELLKKLIKAKRVQK